jgi:hypothetical protein
MFTGGAGEAISGAQQGRGGTTSSPWAMSSLYTDFVPGIADAMRSFLDLAVAQHHANELSGLQPSNLVDHAGLDYGWGNPSIYGPRDEFSTMRSQKAPIHDLPAEYQMDVPRDFWDSGKQFNWNRPLHKNRPLIWYDDWNVPVPPDSIGGWGMGEIDESWYGEGSG